MKISKRVEKELHQKKLVIRRLPPDFTEEKFLQTINPLPINTYFYFAPGDSSLGPYGCSRAYIAFENEEEIVPFRDQYDGLVLESDRGMKYRVIVEYAPFQSTPRKSKKKIDARTGTVEQDSDYTTFLEAYEAKTEAGSTIDLSAYLEELEANKAHGVQSTPLTEYLRDRRASRSRRNRSTAELKKKQKGGESSRSKGKGSRDRLEDDSASKTASEESSHRRGKRKDRGRQDKSTRDSDSATKGADAIEHVEEKGTKTDSHMSSLSSKSIREQDSRKQSSESKGRPESGDRYRGEGRTRNRDRPDKAIYTPRGQGRDEPNRGASGGTGEKGYGKSKEDGGYSQSRSQRSRGRRGDGECRQRDRDEKYSRDRGRGPRDRQKERNESGLGSKSDSHNSYRAA